MSILILAHCRLMSETRLLEYLNWTIAEGLAALSVMSEACLLIAQMKF